MIRRPPRSTLFPTRRSSDLVDRVTNAIGVEVAVPGDCDVVERHALGAVAGERGTPVELGGAERSEEHTSELQSQSNLVCRLLLEKKKKKKKKHTKHNTQHPE